MKSRLKPSEEFTANSLIELICEPNNQLFLFRLGSKWNVPIINERHPAKPALRWRGKIEKYFQILVELFGLYSLELNGSSKEPSSFTSAAEVLSAGHRPSLSTFRFLLE